MRRFLFANLVVIFVLLPAIVSAQFTPLVGIPGVTGDQGLGAYMNAVYRLSITLAALLAVLMIIKGGIEYMFSDIVTTKQAAKSSIKGAILGLLLIISAVLILSTINSNLTNFNIIIDELVLPPSPPVNPPPDDDGNISLSCQVLGGASCSYVCLTILKGVTQGGNCIFNPQNNGLQETLSSLVNEHCPEDVLECRAELCHEYDPTVSESWIPTTEKCRQACTSEGGLHFDYQTTACIFGGDFEDTSFACALKLCVDGMMGCDTTYWDCSESVAQCQGQGGQVLTTSIGVDTESIMCRVRDTDLGDSIREAVCGTANPEECKLRRCDLSWFRNQRCPAQCRDRLGADAQWSSEHQVCYVQSTPDTPPPTSGEIQSKISEQIAGDDDLVEAQITEPNVISELQMELGVELIVVFYQPTIPSVRNELETILRDTCGNDSYMTQNTASQGIIMGCKAV